MLSSRPKRGTANHREFHEALREASLPLRRAKTKHAQKNFVRSLGTERRSMGDCKIRLAAKATRETRRYRSNSGDERKGKCGGFSNDTNFQAS
jgi:hypothetical protein